MWAKGEKISFHSSGQKKSRLSIVFWKLFTGQKKVGWESNVNLNFRSDKKKNAEQYIWWVYVYFLHMGYDL